MKAYERLLNYVKVPTPSNEKSGTHPSSECQRVLADQLAEEMKALGVSDVRVEDKCYVYGKIPATKGYEGKTKLGFIAHMDTVSDFADHAVNPMEIGPCGISPARRASASVIISATPALSSAPSTVVPSLVISVLPARDGRCGNTETSSVLPLSASFRSFPS